MIAGGHQACLTRKQRAGTTARLMGTMREALPSHEEAIEKFETLSMEGGDVRPVGPATPRFVAGDLAHIRSGILGHALSAPAADQVPQGVVRPDGVFCSGHAKGKTTSALMPKAILVCA